MSWLVDNANTLSIVLGLTAAGLVAIWWSNKQIKYLGIAAGALVLILLLWLLACNFVSDSKQLELNVNAMADAVVKGKVDDLFKHISKDFDYQGVKRDQLYANIKRGIEAERVKSVNIPRFFVLKLARDQREATVRFPVNASAEREILFITEADFVLEGEQWRLRTLRFYLPQDPQKEIAMPYLR